MRLPAAFRFDGKEVYIRQNSQTGEVILSRKPADWEEFFKALKKTSVPSNFLDVKERKLLMQERDPFEGWLD